MRMTSSELLRAAAVVFLLQLSLSRGNVRRVLQHCRVVAENAAKCRRVDKRANEAVCGTAMLALTSRLKYIQFLESYFCSKMPLILAELAASGGPSVS